MKTHTAIVISDDDVRIYKIQAESEDAAVEWLSSRERIGPDDDPRWNLWEGDTVITHERAVVVP